MTTSEPITEQTEQIEKVEAVEVVTSAPIKFDVTKAAIEQMIGHAAGLSIAGPDDKSGFEAVYEFRQMVKDQRIEVEKKAKELKAPQLQYNKQVDAVSKMLIDAMKQIENGLALQEKSYKDERARLAHERAMALQNRTEARRKLLREWNFIWNPSNDSFEFAHSGEEVLAINFDDIQKLPDEEFVHISQEAETIVTAEQARLAEIKRVNDENEAALKKQQKLEQDRLDQIAQDQKKEAARIKQEKDDLAKQVLDSRIERLEGLGFENASNGVFVLGYKAFKHTELSALSAYAFKEEITAFIAWKAEQDEKQQQAIERGKLLDRRKWHLEEDFGYVDLIEGGMEAPDNSVITNEQLLAYTDEEFVAFKESLKQAAEQAKQAEIAKQQADQERQKRLAPDKEILLAHLNEILFANGPELAEDETIYVFGSFCVHLKNLVTQYSDKVKAL